MNTSTIALVGTLFVAGCGGEPTTVFIERPCPGPTPDTDYDICFTYPGYDGWNQPCATIADCLPEESPCETLACRGGKCTLAHEPEATPCVGGAYACHGALCCVPHGGAS